MHIQLLTRLLLFCLVFTNTAFAGTTWTPSFNISLSEESPVTNPQVGIDPKGNAVAVWEGNDGIDAATFQAGGSWTSPVNISAVGHRPQVSVDASGNAIAIWSGWSGPNASNQMSAILAATLPFGGTWSEPVVVSSPTGCTPFDPQIAIDSQGNAVAVWQQPTTASHYDIYASTLPFGLSWTTPFIISDGESDAQVPQIVVDASGNAVAIWHGYESGFRIIQAATLPFGGTWEPLISLSAIGQNAFNPHFAINSKGYAVAVWTRFNGSNYIVQASTRSFGGSWSEPSDVSTTGRDAGFGPNSTLDVTVDDNGNAVVVWGFQTGSGYIVQEASLPFGRLWTAPISLSTIRADYVSAHVKATPDGKIMAVWDFFNLDTSQYYLTYATLQSGSNWSSPTNLIVSSEGNISLSQIALNSSNDAFVVWSYSDLSSGSNSFIQGMIYYTPPAPPSTTPPSELPSVLGIQSPTNFNGKQFKTGFITQTEYFNVLTWAPPSGPVKPVGYRLYRNDLTNMIATIPAGSKLKYEDHNRTKKISYTYFLVAVDANGNASAPVSVNVAPL